MHLVEDFLRKIRAHACRYAELPELTVPEVAMTDDDVEAHNDLIYMRALVDDIEATCRMSRARIVDGGLFDADTCLAPWPADPVEELLAAWRAERAA